ncbi:endospore germination permease [Paenibacillus sp. MBLB4367]|uniref:GerAB/ArcD/ProY family transporter n=1 Tax=Paenibacillus sp. MBLB4367 TaxID=3384767 RepID=UPI003908456B
MLEKGKISNRQFTIIVTFFIAGSAILITPTLLASKAKQDAWIAAILAVCIGLLVIPLYNALGKRFSDMNLAEYCEAILGRWLGKTVFLLFLTYPLIGSALTLRNIGDFMSTQFMRETPIQAIHIIFMAVAVMGVRLGLETLVRAAELFFPWIFLLCLILIMLVAPQMKAVNMLPVLEDGVLPVLRATVSFLTFPFLGTVVFLMVYPSVNRIGNAGKSMLTGELMGGIVLTIITVQATAVLGADQVARSSFSSYEIARRISIGNFLERIEAIMAVIWILTIFFRLALLLYVVVLGIAQTFRFREYKFLAIPAGIVIIPLSILIVPNSTYLSMFNQNILPVYLPTFGLLLPLLLLVVAVIRNKRSGSGKSS